MTHLTRFTLILALLLIGSPAAAFTVTSTAHCEGGDREPRSVITETQPDTYEHMLQKMGKAGFYALLALSEKVWSPCSFDRSAPDTFNNARMTASLLFDSALPIKVINVDSTEACDSKSSERFIYGCNVLLTLSLENKTDDVTYTYVALACRGFFRTSPEGGQLGPITQQELKGKLGPHEAMHFDIWYNIGYLQRRYSEDQIKQRGGIRWCHILSASSDVGSYRFTEGDSKEFDAKNNKETSPPTSPPPSYPANPFSPPNLNGLSNETNEFLKGQELQKK